MEWRKFLGLETIHVSQAERFIASAGGLIGITLVFWVSVQFIGFNGAIVLVPSMGAAAVLVFAVPHGSLSQPWQLFVGNLVSAFVGVTCFQWIPDLYLAAGLAVGFAIGAMHLTGSLHPPGGATALAAVIGGEQVHQLGYQYLMTPVLLNVIIIFTIALIFNNLFHWRKYPASLNRFTIQPRDLAQQHAQLLDKQKIEKVMEEMDLVVDASIDDLQYLFIKTMEQMDIVARTELHLSTGRFYTNGLQGSQWVVREIVSMAPSKNKQHDMVMYRTKEGSKKGRADSCTLDEFRHWAAREVFLD